MAAITVQQIVVTGLEAAAETACAAGGDTVINNGRTFVHVTNGSGGDITVTTASQVDCSQGYTHDEDTVVTAGEARYIGPFPMNRYNNSAGSVELTYSGVTSLTIAAYTL